MEPLEILTPRELDVLLRIAKGMTNVEIAADLGLRVSTIENYTHNIYGKLQVPNRAAAVTVGYGHGWIEPLFPTESF